MVFRLFVNQLFSVCCKFFNIVWFLFWLLANGFCFWKWFKNDAKSNQLRALLVNELLP